MRASSEQLLQVLGAATYQGLVATDGPIQFGLVGDVMRGSERLLASVPLVDWSLSWDASGMVEADASVTVVHADYEADGTQVVLDSSWIPTDPSAALAPFGSEVVVYAWVAAGPFYERVQLGVFPIVDAPSSTQATTNVTGEPRILGETISLRLADRMDGVQRDRFTKTTGPRSTQAYDELARLTGRPVVRTLPDKAISRISAYEDDDRAKAVQQVAQLLGGDAFFNSDGALQVRPSAAPAASLTLTLGEFGRVSDVTSPLSREGVYNGVVVTGKDGLIRYEEWVSEGPLSPSLYGRVPFFAKSDFITTVAEAEAYGKRLLAAKSSLKAQVVQVSCLWNPLVEVGDVVTVIEPQRTLRIRVTKVSMGGPQMTVTGSVVS